MRSREFLSDVVGYSGERFLVGQASYIYSGELEVSLRGLLKMGYNLNGEIGFVTELLVVFLREEFGPILTRTRGPLASELDELRGGIVDRIYSYDEFFWKSLLP